MPYVNTCPRSKEALLTWIHLVSFAVNDITLYLDTHPCDKEALEYFDTYSRLRNQALMDFAQAFYPLTIDTVPTGAQQWEWADSPLPWEGGC